MRCIPIFRNASTYWYCMSPGNVWNIQSVSLSLLLVLPCLRLSLIWHTKMKAKSDWSIKIYESWSQYNHAFGVKVMWKYKVLSKRECCVIKKSYSWLLWLDKGEESTMSGWGQLIFANLCDVKMLALHLPHIYMRKCSL